MLIVALPVVSFLAQCGRHLLTVVGSSSEGETNAQLRRKPMAPEDKEALLATERQGQLSMLETWFREVLVAKRMFSIDSL